MALLDVSFNAGEGQDFILELPTRVANSVTDILIEASATEILVLETPLIVDGGGGGNIFIMSE
jgi:hypothetical protein